MALNLLGDMEDDIGCTLDNLSAGCEIGVIEFLPGVLKLWFDINSGENTGRKFSGRQQDPKPKPKNE